MTAIMEAPLKKFDTSLNHQNSAVLDISKLSFWNDDVWILDNPSFGASERDARIPWDFKVYANSIFTDLQWHDLRESLKVFVWSLYCDPREGISPKAGSDVPPL